MQILRSASGLLVVAIGIFMIFSNPTALTPPFCSGIAFILLGLNLWMPNCPLIHGFKCKGGTCSSQK